MEYYCFGGNHVSGTSSSKFTRCQNPYQLVAKSQNFVDISGTQKQKPTRAKFLEVEFFLSEKKRLYRYYQNKNQLEVTSSSYINLRMKLLIKSYLIAQKMGKSEILCFF